MSERSRILVVDDDEQIRELTRIVLADAGFDVLTAGSGRDALRVVRDEAVDLVLLDINMPDIDGWQTLRLLNAQRADEARRALPVVMFSVKSEFRDKIVGMQEGASDYITKPFRADELIARVRKLLAAPLPSRESRDSRESPESR